MAEYVENKFPEQARAEGMETVVLPSALEARVEEVERQMQAFSDLFTRMYVQLSTHTHKEDGSPHLEGESL